MKKIVFLIIVISFFSIFTPGVEASEVDKLKEEVESLKKEVEVLKKDVAGLKKKITGTRKSRPPQIALVSIDDDPVLGVDDAPVTIIEFSDYQCPFCGRFFRTTLPLIKKDYIQAGKAKYVFRDFPLSFHKNAEKAAEAASCAGEQGKYWEMHDKLFNNQRALLVEDIKSYAEEIALDMNSFNLCITNGKYAEEIKKDIEDGQKAGVTGTPSFFIGKTDPKGKVIRGIKIVGARPYNQFKEIIEKVLSERKDF